MSSMPEGAQDGDPLGANTGFPRVSIVIPILNEARTLGATLASIAAQQYPRHLLDVLVVDGGSADNWTEHLQHLAPSGILWRTLANPDRNTSAAVNLALRATDAPCVLWLSGHCILSSNYIATAVHAMKQNTGTIVGGRLGVQGSGLRGQLNAWVLASRFGTGLAPWRHRADLGWARSATYALYDRLRLLELGGLDERLIRNQDTELIARLSRAGMKFMIVDSDATYLAPGTLKGLWRRAWGNGSWIIWSWKLGCPALSWYHLAPMVAVVLGLLLAGLSLWSRIALYGMVALSASYAVIALGFAVSAVVRVRNIWAVPALPLMFLIHHSIYGLGELTALLRPVPWTERTPDSSRHHPRVGNPMTSSFP